MEDPKPAKQYTAAVVDDDDIYREMLLEPMRFTYFNNVEGYDEAETLLCDLASRPRSEMPDLIVVDLQLKRDPPLLKGREAGDGPAAQHRGARHRSLVRPRRLARGR